MSASDTQGARSFLEFASFRMDREKQLLLREGEPVPLTPKAFQLLAVLLEGRNEVVSKDELMKAVWPDTFVEETNLSRNIFALRKALGETDRNRFIVTVPGLGYRFAEQVRVVSEPPRTIVSATHRKVQLRIIEGRRWGPIVIATAVVLVISAGVFHLVWSPRPVLTAKDSVLLAAFANTTSDPVFDGTLRQGLEIQLEQSPFLSLVSEERIRRALTLMGQPSDAQVSGDTAREVCERTGGAVVVEGSIAPLGRQAVLGLRARSCRTGDVIAEEQEQVARKEDVLGALTRVAARFRSRLGESRKSIEEHSTPLAEATTPSLEALRAYSAGWQIHATHGAAAALPFFRHATQLDPQFAMAHAFVGRLYADLDQPELAAASTTRAWQLRERTSEREKFFISTNYEVLVTGNLEAAQQTAATWARTYPREALPHNLLASVVQKTPGRYQEALQETQRAVQLDPDSWIGYYGLGVLNVYLGHLDEGEAALRSAAARGLDADEFIMLAYDIAFLEGDRAGMEREAARARTRPGGENWISAREASVAAYSGRLHDARTFSQRAIAQAQQAGQPERGALWAAGAGVREALFGNKPSAIAWAQSALAGSRSREVRYGSALAIALAGESRQAQQLAADLASQFPEDTAVRFNYIPTVRAAIALSNAAPQHAVELLQAAAPHELGIPASGISGLFGALYPVYFRGQAYLAENKPSEAAAEFQKVLDHRGIVVNDPIGALAQLEIGRAYAMVGETAKAQAAYEAFLAQWKHADIDIPILQQASEESRKLHFQDPPQPSSEGAHRPALAWPVKRW